MDEKVERRLTTVVSADVVSYARLIRADETGTRAAFRGHREALIDPKLAEHNGRLVSTAGDSLLAEFASVVDAANWAIDVQRAMPGRNTDIPSDKQIVFRFGINLGDVIIEGDDIHGDGVNIAARLQAMAEPGGICISANVFEQVRHRLEIGFEDIGDQEVKNIPQPVRAYRVLLEPEAAGQVVVGKEAKKAARHASRKSRWAISAFGAAVAIGIVVAVVLTLEPWVPRVEAADEAKMAYPLPEVPSIAIMPFQNLSGDPEQDYLADGMAVSLITALSKTELLLVMSRNATFAYKGQAVPVKQVAEDLGVQHVLEGSFQRSGDTVRVTAQLIDALSGRQVWAERYDRPWSDIFALQDDITTNIVEELHVELTVGEQGRLLRERAESPEIYQTVLKFVALINRFTPGDNAKARALAEDLVADDPESAGAHLAAIIHDGHRV